MTVEFRLPTMGRMHSRMPPNMKTLIAYTLKWLAGWLALTFVAVALVHQAWVQSEYPADAVQADPGTQVQIARKSTP